MLISPLYAFSFLLTSSFNQPNRENILYEPNKSQVTELDCVFILGGFDVFLELADTVILMKKMRERQGGFSFSFLLGEGSLGCLV